MAQEIIRIIWNSYTKCNIYLLIKFLTRYLDSTKRLASDRAERFMDKTHTMKDETHVGSIPGEAIYASTIQSNVILCMLSTIIVCNFDC